MTINRSNTQVWVAIGLLSVFFHTYLIFSGLIPSLVSRPLHLVAALPWIFLIPQTTFPREFRDMIWFCLAAIACIYLAVNESGLSDQYGFLEGYFQYFIGFVLITTVLEMARRTVGLPLPIVTSLFLLYGFFGHLIPGEFGHGGIPLGSYLGTLIITEGGLWGPLTGVSVSIISIFLIFGAVLNAGEAGRGFMNLAVASAGNLKGGAAKVSVISSALFGSISGSASANVASTGMVTLPTMRKLGYPKKVAGAVEAVASTGGQIMPPLMGAGAFIMVELTGIPYTEVILAASIPALLYFYTVWIGVNRYAELFNLRPIDASEQPSKLELAITVGFFFVPFAVLLWSMFSGYTPQFAAALATVVAMLLLFTGADARLHLKRGFTRLGEALTISGRQISMIASIILCASLIVGVLGITGLGVKITSLILSVSGDSLYLTLALTAVACLFLGMEVPTTAAYVICVSVAGPALIDRGLEPILVHLFVFWYALLSTITPPVCGGVFIAAGMVEENWLKVAVSAMAIGIGLYIIPIGMVTHPEIVNLNNWLYTLIFALKIALGITVSSYGLISQRRFFERFIFIIIGLLIITIK
ncbi:MAG: TRAP transporter permease DctM/Q [Gammaproteobacteria bacterium]|nr:TRAP transporter permease DctM/Q [Gammaproteobacteria bacterium]|tara:strand:+ start:1905 stop:3665 length:1761 start_codon:yes stop_codon:yes gene_type:complete